MNPSVRELPASSAPATCTEVEARLLSVLAFRPTRADSPADPHVPRGRYDGDLADPGAVLEYLQSWGALTDLVDRHLATGDHAPYLTAIGQARRASGASVIVAKRAVELLVAGRARP